MGNMYLTRRQLFEKLYSIAGSAALAGVVPWVDLLHADTIKNSASECVSIGIIGVGSRGSKLLKHLKTIPNVRITAVCDDYQPHYDRALKLTDGKAVGYKDYRKLLERQDIDAVVIATPLHLHVSMTIDAFIAGKDVFCEKALAKTIDECIRLKEAYYKSRKILHVGHQRMFDVCYLEALKKIKAGEIGKITQIKAWWHRNNNWRREVPSPELERKINWRLYKEYSLGLMTELASHHIQVANWFTGTTPLKVMGSGSINFWQDGREVYDNVNLVYEYPGGVHLIYDSLISNKLYGLQIQLMGNKGTIEMETNKIYSETFPEPAGILQLINDIEHKVFDPLPIGGASWVPGTASGYYGEYIVDKRNLPDSTQLSMEAFVESVRQQKRIPDMFEQAMNAAIASILGNEAMEKDEIIYFSKAAKL